MSGNSFPEPQPDSASYLSRLYIFILIGIGEGEN